MVLDEDEKMKHHLQHVHSELDKVDHSVHDLECHMGETEEQWNEAQKHLTEAILKAGMSLGVFKEHIKNPYEPEKELLLDELFHQLNECENCLKGLECPEHKVNYREAVIHELAHIIADQFHA